MSSTFSIDLDHVGEFAERLHSAFSLLHPSEQPNVFVDMNKLIGEGFGTVVQIRPAGSHQVWHHYHSEVERSVADLLECLGVDLSDPNFRETPRRVAAHLRHIFEPLADSEVDEWKRATFPSVYSGMVTACQIPCYGTCAHHLLPVEYQIHVAYIPNEFVIGLSKLPRVAVRIARLPILQEDVTSTIADLLQDVLLTKSVAVVVEGKHLCMGCRGVKSPETVVTTAEMRGVFAENDKDAKNEFMSYIDRGRI